MGMGATISWEGGWDRLWDAVVSPLAPHLAMGPSLHTDDCRNPVKKKLHRCDRDTDLSHSGRAFL